MPLPTPDNEALFDRLAQAVDAAGPQGPLLLAKFALLLANEVGDRARVDRALEEARRHLDLDPPGPRTPNLNGDNR